MLYNSSGKNKTVYKNIGYFDNSGSYRKNIKILGLGNSKILEEKNPEYESIIKSLITNYDEKVDVVYLKSKIEQALNQKQTSWKTKNAAIELIMNFIDEHNIFESINVGKHKGMKEILCYQISKRISEPQSIFQNFLNRNENIYELDYSKNSFYRMFDVLLKSKNKILKKINEINNKKPDINDKNIMFFDSTTIYFESFTKDGLKHPGYSKDGKFKEDQIVLAMACDTNGIPIHYKVFVGNTADVKTLIPFISEVKDLYPNKKVIVVSDRGMSSAENIKFLEKNKIDYIISYRAKVASKKYKEYLLQESDYIWIHPTFKLKEKESAVAHRKSENVVYKRKQVITWSQSRAFMDKNKRENEINNFIKNQDKKGRVNVKKMIGFSKSKYFKNLGDSIFVLDEEKVRKDEEFDGYYVYETSLINLPALDVVDIYAMQWKIEENFRTLKNTLSIRPMYVYTDNHIEGYILFSFLTLFIFRYLSYKIKEFYKNNGVIQKITDDSMVDVFRNMEYIVEENNFTKTNIQKFKSENELSKISWSVYNDYYKYIKSNK